MKLAAKIQSRKFLVSCAVIAFLCWQREFSAVVTVTLGYLAVQGGVDAYTKSTTELPPE